MELPAATEFDSIGSVLAIGDFFCRRITGIRLEPALIAIADEPSILQRIRQTVAGVRFRRAGYLHIDHFLKYR